MGIAVAEYERTHVLRNAHPLLAGMSLTHENTGPGDPGGNASDSDVTVASSPKTDGQFDFQKFLDQMKTKGADPIAKYLRR